MPFIDSSNSLPSKLHLGSSKVVGASIALVALAAVALGAFNVVQMGAQDDFVLVRSSAASEGPSSSEEAQEGGPPQAEGAPDADADAATEVAAGADKSAAASTIFVYVSGAVGAPGVYELPADSRVNDALQAAGGFSEDAQQEAVNLARLLSDGEQVHIARQGEEAPATPEASGQVASAEPASSESGLVNINTADQTQLESLPGVGPATAGKIIAYREESGAFSSIEEIKNVSGIGDKKFASIADLITV